MEFEISKENVQPLRGGRNVNQLEVALQAQFNTDLQMELMQQKQRWDEVIRTYEGDDPLENWYNYISWTEQSYPKHGHEGNLVPLLEDCLSKFENDQRYINDNRTCKLWIKYIYLHQNQIDLFQLLHSNNICTGCTDFYRAWAFYYEMSNDFKRAEAIFQLGLKSYARPYDELVAAHESMLLAIGKQAVQGVDENRLLEQRHALTSLRTYRERNRTVVPNVRTHSQILSDTPGVVHSVIPPKPSTSTSNVPVTLYEDPNEPGPSVGGGRSAQPSVLDLIRRQGGVQKENTLKPGPWNSKKNIITPSVAQHRTPSFKVHEDEETTAYEGIRLPPDFAPMNHDDFSEWETEICVPDPPNPNQIAMYPKHFVYAEPNTEYSLEEIRARKWFGKFENNAHSMHESLAMESTNIVPSEIEHAPIMSQSENVMTPQHSNGSQSPFISQQNISIPPHLPHTEQHYQSMNNNKIFGQTNHLSYAGLYDDGIRPLEQSPSQNLPSGTGTFTPNQHTASRSSSSSYLQPTGVYQELLKSNCDSPRQNVPIYQDSLNNLKTVNEQVYLPSNRQSVPIYDDNKFKMTEEENAMNFDAFASHEQIRPSIPFFKDGVLKQTYVPDNGNGVGISNSQDNVVSYDHYQYLGRTNTKLPKVLSCTQTSEQQSLPAPDMTLYQDKSDSLKQPGQYLGYTNTKLPKVLSCMQTSEQQSLPLPDMTLYQDKSNSLKQPEHQSLNSFSIYQDDPKQSYLPSPLKPVQENNSLEPFASPSPFLRQSVPTYQDEFVKTFTPKTLQEVNVSNLGHNSDAKQTFSHITAPEESYTVNTKEALKDINDIWNDSSIEEPQLVVQKPVISKFNIYEESGLERDAQLQTNKNPTPRHFRVPFSSQPAPEIGPVQVNTVGHSQPMPATNFGVDQFNDSCTTRSFNFNLDSLKASTPFKGSPKRDVDIGCEPEIQNEFIPVRLSKKSLFDECQETKLPGKLSVIFESTNEYRSSSSSGSCTTPFKSIFGNNFKTSLLKQNESSENKNVAQNLIASNPIDQIIDLTEDDSVLKSPIKMSNLNDSNCSTSLKGFGGDTDFSFESQNSNSGLEFNKMENQESLSKFTDNSNLLENPPSNPFSKAFMDAILKSVDFPDRKYANSLVQIQTIPKFTSKKNNTVSLGDEKYSMVQVIGKGAYGMVYKARNLITKKFVAIKYQKPPNTWEYYICKEIQERITNPYMLRAFMDVSVCYMNPKGSLLVSDYFKCGSLLDLKNKVKQTTGKSLTELATIYYATEIMTIVNTLHKMCQIIHADIKPDNFLVTRLPPEFGHPSLQLIDFGCSIDMSVLPEGAAFTRLVSTENFICTEMKEGRPWNYHTDLFCIAATVHVLLFEKYMEVRKVGDTWTIAQNYPRYMHADFWNSFFHQLLNIESIDKLPDLQSIRASFEGMLTAHHKDVQHDLRTMANAIHGR